MTEASLVYTASSKPVKVTKWDRLKKQPWLLWPRNSTSWSLTPWNTMPAPTSPIQPPWCLQCYWSDQKHKWKPQHSGSPISSDINSSLSHNFQVGSTISSREHHFKGQQHRKQSSSLRPVLPQLGWLALGLVWGLFGETSKTSLLLMFGLCLLRGHGHFVYISMYTCIFSHTMTHFLSR